MKRMGSWYFDGFKREEYTKPNGKKSSRLVYVGEWYGFPGGREEMLRLKKAAFLLTALSCIPYFYAQFNPAEGGMVHWMAIPSLLSLVPLIYMIIGLINFLPSKDKWEIRVYYSGYRRLYRSAVVVLVLMCIWIVMEAVYIVMNLSSILSELAYFLCVVASTAFLACMIVLIRRHPAVVIEGPKVE